MTADARALDLSGTATAVQRWLVEAGREDDDGTAFARDLVACLTEEHRLPMWRVSYALMTKHPEVLWRTVQWREGEAVTIRDQPHARLEDAFYTKSPVALARRTRDAVRVRLTEGALPFPICEDLRAAGGTDYLALPLPFTNGEVTYVSFATRAVDGFSDELVALLTGLAPFLARRLELESAYYATRALLDVYLGRNASRRVLAGAFQRGQGELIDAAIWFSDMRDFTTLSDGSSPAQVIQILDRTFDAVASAIAAHGGEVLKFIGDAVLAIFPVGDAPAQACENALAAAEQAFASLAELNAERAAQGSVPIAIGVALHRGQVMYGNIGARDRLDFTVISAAVNEASRLESLCKSLGTRLALSEAFASSSGRETADLGAHALKGVRAPLRVFTLPAHVVDR